MHPNNNDLFMYSPSSEEIPPTEDDTCPVAASEYEEEASNGVSPVTEQPKPLTIQDDRPRVDESPTLRRSQRQQEKPDDFDIQG